MVCFLGMSENQKGWRLIDPKTIDLTDVRSAHFQDDLTLHAWKIHEKLQPEELDVQTFDIMVETEDVTPPCQLAPVVAIRLRACQLAQAAVIALGACQLAQIDVIALFRFIHQPAGFLTI